MIPNPLMDALIDRALAEDLSGGDLTTEACVSSTLMATANAVAKESLVVCGGQIFARTFERLNPSVRVQARVQEGVLVEKGAVLLTVEGPAATLLQGERTALNFIQRMSGVASLARTFVALLPKGSCTRIADTRKTTPGLRMLERYAVRTGGAHNHRDNLGSAVMIKDNHIVAAGGITKAVALARARAPHTTRIEVEVANMEEFDEAMAASADVIMLDNFSDELVRKAVARRAELRKDVLLEVSGGINLERIPTLGAMGLDVISVGALTHSTKAADISLDLKLLT